MSDESLFREVDEEIRQEQFKKLWARYGTLIIAVCLVVVLAVAGYQGWRYWQLKQSEAAGAAFFSAVDLAAAGKTEDAARQLETIDHQGFGVLARIREANVLATQGKTAEALAIYDAVAADSVADGSLRDLARVRAAAAVVDSAGPADMEARVKSFDAAGNPWRHIARELLAVSYWRAEDFAAADKMVQAILADPETPIGVRQRAQTLADLLIPALAQK